MHSLLICFSFSFGFLCFHQQNHQRYFCSWRKSEIDCRKECVIKTVLGQVSLIRSAYAQSHLGRRRRIRNTTLPAMSNTVREMKLKRSMTDVAASHSFISCWSLSIWWRRPASLRVFASSRSWIEINTRSTELMLCPVDAAAAAADNDDDENVDDIFDSWWLLTSFDASTLCKSTSAAAASITGIFFRPTYLVSGHESLLNYKQTQLFQPASQEYREITSFSIKLVAVLSQGNRAMPQQFFLFKVRRQHSLQV